MGTSLKVLVVMGSPRKGNTYRAAERIREFMETHGSVELEYLWLRDANLLPCRGCALCVAMGGGELPEQRRCAGHRAEDAEADGPTSIIRDFGRAVVQVTSILFQPYSLTPMRPEIPCTGLPPKIIHTMLT